MKYQRPSTVIQIQFCMNVNREAMSHSEYFVLCLTHFLQELIRDQWPYHSKRKVSLSEIHTLAITPF